MTQILTNDKTENHPSPPAQIEFSQSSWPMLIFFMILGVLGTIVGLLWAIPSVVFYAPIVVIAVLIGIVAQQSVKGRFDIYTQNVATISTVIAVFGVLATTYYLSGKGMTPFTMPNGWDPGNAIVASINVLLYSMIPVLSLTTLSCVPYLFSKNILAIRNHYLLSVGLSAGVILAFWGTIIGVIIAIIALVLYIISHME